MASAVKDEIEVEVTTTVKKPCYVLTLSEDEARFLLDIMNRIGGNPVTTRRLHEKEISVALGRAGLSLFGDCNDLQGEIDVK